VLFFGTGFCGTLFCDTFALATVFCGSLPFVTPNSTQFQLRAESRISLDGRSLVPHTAKLAGGMRPKVSAI